MKLKNFLKISLLKKKRENIPNNEELELKEKTGIEEKSGKLDTQDEENKLLHSVIENDENVIDDGRLVNDSLNQGISAFTPDMIFDNLKQDYANAEKLYGDRILRMLTGYDPSYTKKNIRIPEFCRELKENLTKNIKNLNKKGIINNEGTITSKGVYLASLVLYIDELDKLTANGLIGEIENKKKFMYGDKEDVRNYHNADRFKDIDMKKTVKQSIRRQHKKILKSDLQVVERKSKGNIEIIYAIDSSGSMKGKKIETAKKAGIALAFKAIENKDKVGLIVFGTDIKEAVNPTLDFKELLINITEIRASSETNFLETINHAVRMFSDNDNTKHLILLTDAVPTIGSDPEKDTLKSIANASSQRITTSLIGIDLDAEGEKFAKELTEIGNGKMYSVSKEDNNADQIILTDYYNARNG
jgi:Mg-chelatase subunit ChlD